MAVVAIPSAPPAVAGKLTVHLPGDVLASLRAEAEDKGRSAEEIAAEQLVQYPRARTDANR